MTGRAVLPVAVALTAVLAGCGSPAAPGAPTAAAPAESCGPAAPADPSVVLPSGLPLPPGAVLVREAAQGSTRVVFAELDGADFVAVRDDVAEALRSGGYEISGTDQEAVEAEVHTVTPLDTTVKVSVACAGRLAVRYRISPP